MPYRGGETHRGRTSESLRDGRRGGETARRAPQYRAQLDPLWAPNRAQGRRDKPRVLPYRKGFAPRWAPKGGCAHLGRPRPSVGKRTRRDAVAEDRGDCAGLWARIGRREGGAGGRTGAS